MKNPAEAFSAASQTAVATAAAFLMLFLLACGAPPMTTTTTMHLISLVVTPSASSIALGQVQQLKATGVFSDGTIKDLTQSAAWTSSTPALAGVDASGLVTSLSPGAANVTAAIEDFRSSAVLSISKAALVSIALSPEASSVALGNTIQLTATGTYTDKTTQDLSSLVTWTSSQPDVAVMSSSGLAVSRSIGTSTVAAALGSIDASTPLTVSAAGLVSIAVAQNHTAIPLGTTAQFTAKGTYTDGSTQDLTSSVRWSSLPAGVLNMASTGLATTKTTGAATITAASGPISGSGALTVTAAALTSISVVSSNPAMPLGTRQQLTATGTYTDGSTHDLTTSAAWSSTSADVVTSSGGGLVSANSLGSATISAVSAAISGNIDLTVSQATLSSISITPASLTMPLAGSHQLSATGIYTDGSSHDITQSVTWTVDDPTVAGIDSTGTATALKVGATNVESSSGGATGSITLTVQPLSAVGYFTHAASDPDANVRMTNPGTTGANLCSMVYVFDQDQQMAECCGCVISPDGLRTLSLKNDLLSNPLTGVSPVAGSVMLVPSDYATNTSCNAATLTPSGLTVAWATHLQTTPASPATATETPLSLTPLDPALTSALQAQCSFIQQLGSGHGICSCGTGD
ncbi:Ig-like domain-containing protein [Paracidobacterium acidisoli]|uniref:BIG2 domain-containing protein n=1 Tax=Paracidobacterium acidisoli TaxID=2303751 RepID=A0A372ITR1_9BACT|nr:Ig-like domain-containing protein [Paracidobacterium acidisoli]MBT9329589.1 Ig-like domain-containing protein [Paracidobacterium acidisoli]